MRLLEEKMELAGRRKSRRRSRGTSLDCIRINRLFMSLLLGLCNIIIVKK